MAYVHNFHICGISFKTASLKLRSKYALGTEKQAGIYRDLVRHGTPGMVLSTCNRSEIYFFAEDPAATLKTLTEGNELHEKIVQLGYLKSGKEAVTHMVRVAAGMESQIPGDFEISGQVKRAFADAETARAAHPLLERIVNMAIHTSRRIKNETDFSSGVSSVSYACVRYIRDHVPDIAGKHILVFGLGKMGRITLGNLLKHFGKDQISVLNRSEDKMIAYAQEYGLRGIYTDDRNTALSRHDVIIIATGAENPIIFPSMLSPTRPQWIIDLSVPNNVDQSVHEMAQTTLINVDQLSKMINETLHRRVREASKAEKIIDQELGAFYGWYQRRELARLVDDMESSLRDATKEILEACGVHLQNGHVTESMAQRHKAVIFDHLLRFFDQDVRGAEEDSFPTEERA